LLLNVLGMVARHCNQKECAESGTQRTASNRHCDLTREPSSPIWQSLLSLKFINRGFQRIRVGKYTDSLPDLIFSCTVCPTYVLPLSASAPPCGVPDLSITLCASSTSANIALSSRHLLAAMRFRLKFH